jgi:hypothetical protein
MTMQPMNSHRLPEVHPMLFVDCPICDGPSPLDAADVALECDACGIRVEIAEPDPVALPAAA